MKTFKKVLCVMLSVLMAFSCLTVAASAEGETVKSSFKYYAEKSDAYNAKVTLDKIDELLKEANICEEVELTDSIKIVVDFRSVNALCGTIDEYYKLLRFGVFVGALVLGDLKDLNLKGWQEGMTRTEDDILILKEIIELAAANRGLVEKICDGSIDLGIFANFIDVTDLLGEDGVSGIIKEMLIGVVYEKDSTEFKNAYNTYKNDVDSFIYGELISKFANEYLPGFELNESSTVEKLICLAAEIAIDKYLIDVIKQINIDLASADVPALKALDGIVNLKGSTYDLSAVTLDSELPLLGQLNGLFGAVAKQMVPGYTGWQAGDYDKIDDNLEGLLNFVATKSNLIPGAAGMSFEELAVEVVAIILENADFGAYEAGLEECDNLEDMATVLLKNVVSEMNIGVEYDEDDNYLVVAADTFAYWFYDRFDVKDLNGNSYQVGGGKDAFEVANYYLNYFLFDKSGAAVAGLETTKQESFFVKLDKILDYFGETKSKGVSFDSEEFFLGSGSKKGLLDSILTLDIENILELTIVPALNTAGDVSAVEFIYKTVQHLLNNWAGKTLFPAYQSKPFTNALSNKSIANVVAVLLEVLDARKSSIIDLATYVAALVFHDDHVVYNVTEASVEDCIATGERLSPEATISIDGKALTYGKDFIVQTDASAPGQAKAKIKLIGMYDGSVERSFNVKMDAVEKISFLSNANNIKVVWSKIPFADGYNINLFRNGKFETVNAELVTGNEFILTGLTSATEYTVRVDAVSAAYGTSAGKEASVATIPGNVDAKTIKTKTDASRARFVWTPVAGASHYRIEKYAGSNKWQEVLVTDKTDVIVSGLNGYTSYNFRITALKKTSGGAYVASTPASVTVKTTIGPVSTVKVSYSSTSITLQWAPVTNTQKYVVLQNINGAWKQIAVLDANQTSYKATGLKAATKYHYAVRAAVKDNGTWKFGDAYIVSQYTGLLKPTTFKVSATDASAAKIVWSKVPSAKGYEVFQYIDGKWVSKGITKNTSATLKGLPSGTNTYFRVRAVTTVDGKYHYGDATGHIAALTLPGAVTGFKAVERKQTSIKLSWNKVTGAAGYQIFRLHNGKWVSLGTTTALSCTDTKSLKKGTEYQYKIRAVQKVGSTLKYGEASAALKTSTPYMNITLR